MITTAAHCAARNSLGPAWPQPDTTARSRGAICPGFVRDFRPKERARGNAGCPVHPQPRVRWVVKTAHEYSQRSHRKSPGIPARNGFNGFLRDLPGDRLFCRRRLQRLDRKLDASVEASGPHDFSVRFSAVRQKRCLRPPQPVPTFVTMANAPLAGRDGGDRKVICLFGKPEYFCKGGLTGPLQNSPLICPSG